MSQRNVLHVVVAIALVSGALVLAAGAPDAALGAAPSIAAGGPLAVVEAGLAGAARSGLNAPGPTDGAGAEVDGFAPLAAHGDPAETVSGIAPGGSGDAERFRRQLAAFVTDLYQVLPPTADSMAAGRPPLDEVLQAVDGLNPREITTLEEVYGPLVATWRLIDAVSWSYDPRPPLGPAAFTQGDADELEALRRDLDAYFARMAPLAVQVGAIDPNFGARITESRSWVQNLTLDELLQVQEALALTPSWREILSTDPAAVLGT